VPKAPRLLALAWLPVLAGAGLPFALAPAGCGTDAVGIEACRQIQTARCNALQQCVFDVETKERYSADQAKACTDFYRDQCLVGIENDTKEPTDATIKGCVAAVNAVSECAKQGVATLSDCGVALVEPADATKFAPCDIITSGAELLSACAFVVRPADAGTPIDATSDTGNDAASDASSD
jgi:hypothetical protein